VRQLLDHPVASRLVESLNVRQLLDHPVADHPVASRLIADHPVADHPVASRLIADHPVASRLIADHPVAKTLKIAIQIVKNASQRLVCIVETRNVAPTDVAVVHRDNVSQKASVLDSI
jgi:hypothetical protein